MKAIVSMTCFSEKSVYVRQSWLGSYNDNSEKNENPKKTLTITYI